MNRPLTQMAEWLFGGAAGTGEGLDSTLDHSWPWPSWVTLLLLIAGAVYVFSIYFHERTASGRRLKVLLASIRLALIGLLIFMMYGYVLRPYQTDLPDIVVVVDDTVSMSHEDRYEDARQQAELTRRIKAAGLDQTTRFNLAKAVLLERDGALLRTLRKKYKLKFYLLGASARALAGDEDQLTEKIKALEPSEPTSRLGQGVRAVLEAQRGRPTAAIIVLTDGITTEGKSIGEVADYARRKAVPLFTVGVGSTKPVRDLEMSDLLVDEVVFVKDVVLFNFKVTGTGYEGRQVDVQLKQKDQQDVLARVTITIGPDGQPQRVRLPYRPEEVGQFEYVVRLVPLEGEASTQNNRQGRIVSVRDDKIRVLLVQADPSFEFRYLKNMFGRDKEAIQLTTVLHNADLDYVPTDETAVAVFPVRREELFRYDVIIFGDVDPAFLSLSVMNNIADFVTEKGGGLVFIAGPSYTPWAYRNTPLADLMPIHLDAIPAADPRQAIVDSFVVRPTELGLASPQMQLGDSIAETADIWQGLPPLYWLLETPSLKPGARVLAEHPSRTGNDGRPLPIVSMHYVGAGKVIFHAVDETHRWRFRRGDVLFARYWVQTMRYLSRSKLLGKDRSAELVTDRRRYFRGEPVRLRTRFLDGRVAPPQDDGVTVVVERQGSRNRRINLRRSAASQGIFEATLSDLAEGNYHAWVSTPTLPDGAPWSDFTVVAPPGEKARLEMDEDDLRQAADRSNGRFYTMANVDDLLAHLPRGRQVRIKSLTPISIWNCWIVVLLFVGLLVTEWLLRKRAGML